MAVRACACACVCVCLRVRVCLCVCVCMSVSLCLRFTSTPHSLFDDVTLHPIGQASALFTFRKRMSFDLRFLLRQWVLRLVGTASSLSLMTAMCVHALQMRQSLELLANLSACVCALVSHLHAHCASFAMLPAMHVGWRSVPQQPRTAAAWYCSHPPSY